MKQVLAYFSSDSFSQQEVACQAFAAKNDWDIVRVLREPNGISQKFLIESLELASGGVGIDTIIVECAERLSPNPIGYELFIREAKARGVKIYAANSGEELVNAAGDPLICHTIAAVDNWNKSTVIRQLQAGRRKKVLRTGKPCGGKRPNEYGDRGGTAQRNVEQLVIKTILNLREEGLTYPAIVKRLHAARIKRPHGHKGRLGCNVVTLWGNRMVERIVKKWGPRIL